ncbi:PaaI family thioesterase [Erythrobacter sp.]|uniref:PaaI family thioesterase n=1 Tax=Erythrobacter sp. TaxID=1042 RepID=UPI001B10CB22|nr:PaaI family thioesterase [Erythrobacter sp.]MBO6527001.1 PaaI family thioesterase [Erythrobacter sp.]MBO6528882.1 PaaI family thioesterase [Erythrobacter sp.]
MAETPEIEALTPYARSLGITLERWDDGTPVLSVPFEETVEGRPEHYHGGATGGLLETAGYAALRAELARQDRGATLKPINITVQYLAAGKSRTSYALGRITKLGRRSANITVEAWQDDRARPIATAVMNVLMAEP